MMLQQMCYRQRWSSARAVWYAAVVRAGRRRAPGVGGGGGSGLSGPDSNSGRRPVDASQYWAGAARTDAKVQNLLFTMATSSSFGWGWGRVLAAVANGFPMDACSPAGLTLLHFAAQAGALDEVEVMLRFGADPNAVTPEGWSPLSFAVHMGHTKVVQALVQGGADVNAFTAAAFESGPTSLLGLAHKEDTLRCLLAQPDLDLSVVTKSASRRWAAQFTTGMQPRPRFVDLVVEEVRMLG